MERFRDKWTKAWKLENIPDDPTLASLQINPFTMGPMHDYLLDLIEYPHYTDQRSTVYVGGVKFTGPLAVNNELDLNDSELASCNGNRGAFDFCNQAFSQYITEIGIRFNCIPASTDAFGRFCELIRQFTDIAGPTREELDSILDIHDKLSESLHAFSIAVSSADAKTSGQKNESIKDKKNIVGRQLIVRRGKSYISYPIATHCTSKRGLKGIAFHFGKWTEPLCLYSQRPIDLMSELYIEYEKNTKLQSNNDGFVKLPPELVRNYANAFPKAKRKMMQTFIDPGRGIHKGSIRLTIPDAFLS